MNELGFYAKEDDKFYSGNLILMSWVATFKNNEPGYIEQLNPAFQEFIPKSKKGVTEFTRKSNEITITDKSNNPVTLENFLNVLIDDKDGQVNVAKDFYKAICKAATEKDNSSFWEDYQPTDKSKPISIELFRNRTVDGEIMNIGARVSAMEGIYIPVNPYYVWQVKDYEIAERYDLVTTLILDEKTNVIEGIQGVFIPAQRRYSKVKELWRNKVLSEISRVISRSFAHNLGSHALIKIQDTVFSPTIAEINAITSEGKKFVQKDEELECLKDIKTFIGYLNNRSQIMASISSGMPPAYTLRLMIEDDLALGFSSQKLLLKHLCDECEIVIDKSFIDNKTENSLVDIVGGYQGKFAFYSILENFARNSMRHMNRKEVKPDKNGKLNSNQGDIKLKVVLTIEGGYNKFEIYDENALLRPEVQIEPEIERLNKIMDNCADYFKSIHLKDDGSFFLGSFEMLIWASYLRGIPVFDVLTNHKTDKPNQDKVHERILTYEPKGNDNIKLVIYTPISRLAYREKLSEDSSVYSKFTIVEETNSVHRSNLKTRVLIRQAEDKYRSPFGTICGKGLDDSNIQNLWINNLLDCKSVDKLSLVFFFNEKKAKIEIRFNERVKGIFINKVPKDFGDLPDGKIAIWEPHNNIGDNLRIIKEIRDIRFYESLKNRLDYRELVKCIYTTSDEKLAKQILGDFVEASLLSILIIDERFDSENMVDEFKNRNIFHFAPQTKEDLLSFIPAEDYDLVSFHVSLKSFFKQDDGEKEFSDWMSSKLSKARYIGYHTGRGSDSSLSKHHSIIDVMSIRQYIFSSESNKFNAVQLLINSSHVNGCRN